MSYGDMYGRMKTREAEESMYSRIGWRNIMYDEVNEPSQVSTDSMPPPSSSSSDSKTEDSSSSSSSQPPIPSSSSGSDTRLPPKHRGDDSQGETSPSQGKETRRQPYLSKKALKIQGQMDLAERLSNYQTESSRIAVASYPEYLFDHPAFYKNMAWADQLTDAQSTTGKSENDSLIQDIAQFQTWLDVTTTNDLVGDWKNFMY